MKEQYIKYWELFIKQKAGDISNKESGELASWMDADEKNKLLIGGFEQIYSESSSEGRLPEFDPKQDWEELKSIIEAEKAISRNNSIRIFPWIVRVAAAVILILGFSYLFYQYQSTPLNDLNLQTMVRTEDTKQMLELPDGSIVWLNRNSELLFPEAFDGSTRTLYLKGEAFFEVAHDKNKPFIVHSGSSKTKVLGTSFNLRAYGKEDEVKLTVVTGKVAFTLADDKEGVIVTPGDAAVLRNKSKMISELKNEDVNFLSWKTGELLFDDCPLDQLIYSVERHYNIKVKVEHQETLTCRFTGNFQDTSIEDVMKVITRATGTTYQMDRDKFFINGIACQ